LLIKSSAEDRGIAQREGKSQTGLTQGLRKKKELDTSTSRVDGKKASDTQDDGKTMAGHSSKVGTETHS